MTTDITEPADIDSDDVDLRFEVDGRDTGTNVSIVDECEQAAKVIGALEKAQTKAVEQGRTSCELFDEVTTLRQRIAELESRTVTVKLPPLNDDLISILGRPNFMCAHLAELLRKSGEDIKRKSEHEQAAIIHWFLGIYLEHGDKWEDIAKSDIQARAAGIKWEVE